MKRTLNLVLFIFFINTVYGKRIDSIQIDAGQPLGIRHIVVYTPANYDFETGKKFEVVYVLDAQQREIFDAVHATIAFQNYGLVPMIVVGIISENRNKDFLPLNKHKDTYQELRGQLGDADHFRKFIGKKLMPFIEANYRTLPTKIGVGYSNGGTFLNHVLLTESDLFDAYFSIDANFNYDHGQLPESIKLKSTANAALTNSPKFYYTCQTSMNNGWVENSRVFNSYLEKSNTLILKSDFFNKESHSTVFQLGVINAFKEYFRYQFFNAANLISYYKVLEKKGELNLKAKDIHRIASTFQNNGLKEDARKFMLGFQDKLSGEIEDTNNLYELFETGNLYLELGFKEIANKYFMLCDRKLEENKAHISKEDYTFGKNMVQSKLKLINTPNGK